MSKLVETKAIAFLEKLAELRPQSDDILQRFRNRAWERFIAMDLSTYTSSYRYLKLTDLFSLPSLTPLPQRVNDHHQETANLFFEDGTLSAQKGAVLGELTLLPINEENFHRYHSFFENHYERVVEQENDPLSLLSLAFMQEPLFLYLPPRRKLSCPLHIMERHGRSPLALTNLILLLGEESSLTLVRSHRDETTSPSLHLSRLDLYLEERAQAVVEEESCHVSDKFFASSTLRAQLKRGAHCNLHALTQGSSWFHQEIKVSLLGEESSANYRSLSLLGDRRRMRTKVTMDHIAPNGRSNQLCKSVLTGHSLSSFRGSIFVAPEAQKTESYQMSRALLLSSDAHANSEPNLEISADDVKASHGCTTGNISEEELHYLLSRGIDRTTARNLLIAAFCEEVLAFIQSQELRQTMEKCYQSFLS